MKFSSFSSAKLVLGATALQLLTGCGLLLTGGTAIVTAEKPVPPIGEDPYIRELAQQFGLMAHFANLAYRKDLDANADHCNLTTQQAMEYGMYSLSDGRGGWSRWKPGGTVAACVDHPSGLFYETYVFGAAGEAPSEAVIAFRGTESKSKYGWVDWHSNFAAFFGFEPEQYHLAHNDVQQVIAALKETNEDISIYAVGHSLGGGLAQQAGYLSKDIKEVFTFNTSPVTNWTRLALHGIIQNDYPVFYRFYHQGEILNDLRYWTTAFSGTRYNRYDIGVQIWPKTMFEGHAMSIISCGLAEIITKETTDLEADHFYSQSAAHQHLGSNACGDYRKAQQQQDRQRVIQFNPL